jgi:hypothetical protein
MDAAALATSYTATETKLARGEVGSNLDAARELSERFQSQYKRVVPFVYSHFTSSPMMVYQAEDWTVINRFDTAPIWE